MSWPWCMRPHRIPKGEVSGPRHGQMSPDADAGPVLVEAWAVLMSDCRLPSWSATFWASSAYSAMRWSTAPRRRAWVARSAASTGQQRDIAGFGPLGGQLQVFIGNSQGPLARLFRSQAGETNIPNWERRLADDRGHHRIIEHERDDDVAGHAHSNCAHPSAAAFGLNLPAQSAQPVRNAAGAVGAEA